jgi:predicted patatin/cPLA2 family phospholipase
MKTAWIFPGGSARAIYTAGVIYALCEMDIPKPDIIVGCSGSGPTSLCYLSGQKEIIKDVWCKSLSNRKFLSLWRFWKILNIDYLIDGLLKEKFPLNLEAIYNSPVELFMPLTDSTTGKPEYLSNKSGLDILEISRGCVFIPLIANLFAPYGIPLNNKFYFDCAPSSRYQLHVEQVKKWGAQRIIVFDNWNVDEKSKVGFLFSKIFTLTRNKIFKKNQFQYFRDVHDFKPPQDIELIVLSPISLAGMGRWNNENKNAQIVFQSGYNETLTNKKLLDLYK